MLPGCSFVEQKSATDEDSGSWSRMLCFRSVRMALDQGINPAESRDRSNPLSYLVQIINDKHINYFLMYLICSSQCLRSLFQSDSLKKIAMGPRSFGFGGMKDVDKVHNEKSPVVADRTLTI